MGKGLPCFKLRHIVWVSVIPGTDGLHGFLRFAAGGDDEHDRLFAHAAPAASAGRRPSGTPTVMLGSMSDSGSSISPAMSARKSSSVSSTSRMTANEPAVGSCGGCAGDVGSAAIESLLGFGETVEDDGFGRVGTVGEEFGELLALVGRSRPAPSSRCCRARGLRVGRGRRPCALRAYFKMPS